MKPIQVGCWALIVKASVPTNIGKKVQVIAHDPSCPDGLVWEIQGNNLKSLKGKTDKLIDCTVTWARNDSLMRIDGYDTPTETMKKEKQE